MGLTVFASLDGIIIVSKGTAASSETSGCIFASMFSKPDPHITCTFLQKKNTFLGHVSDGNAILTTQNKITAVRKLPTSTSHSWVSAVTAAASLKKYIYIFIRRASPNSANEEGLTPRGGRGTGKNISTAKDITAPIMTCPGFKRVLLTHRSIEHQFRSGTDAKE